MSWNSRTLSYDRRPNSIMRAANVAAFWLLCFVCFVNILSFAWVAEDAYISFRVVDNFVHGYGLRWNVDERVQVYTHPLWMLLHIPFYALFGNIYVVTICLSLACGLAGVILLCRMVRSSLLHKAVLLIMPLGMSVTFGDFLVCGLENPLSLLLLSWFMFELSRTQKEPEPYRIVLIASLLLLTRFDTIWLIAPTLSWVLFSNRKTLSLGKCALYSAPLWCWCGFSLFYYGFVLPNTKYAKLNTGIGAAELAKHGWAYLVQFFYHDTLAFAVIAAALAFGACYAWRSLRREPVHYNLIKAALLSAGCLLHIIYVIAIGGDFMSGRFMFNAFVVSLGVVHFGMLMPYNHYLLGVAALLFAIYVTHANILQPMTPYRGEPYEMRIDHDRLHFVSTNGLLSDKRRLFRTEPSHPWIDLGKDTGRTKNVSVGRGIGMVGFYAGPNAILIDSLALSDPLLARMPMAQQGAWRIGHFRRDIPDGYLYARETGDSSKMPPQLAAYYEKLRLVTSGDLLSFERFKAILGFQIGAYDGLLNEYLTQKQ